MKRRRFVDGGTAATAGVLVLILTLGGLAWSARASAAQWLYFVARYGPASGDTAQCLGLAASAYRLYPFNYRFSTLVAEEAWRSAERLDGEHRSERLRLARLWCARGLRQNFYQRPLRRLNTRFLRDEDPDLAIDYWRTYTDWHFWDPHNHAVLAELYAEVGDFARAEDELGWVEGSADYADTKARIEDARRSLIRDILD